MWKATICVAIRGRAMEKLFARAFQQYYCCLSKQHQVFRANYSESKRICVLPDSGHHILTKSTFPDGGFKAFAGEEHVAVSLYSHALCCLVRAANPPQQAAVKKPNPEAQFASTELTPKHLSPPQQPNRPFHNTNSKPQLLPHLRNLQKLDLKCLLEGEWSIPCVKEPILRQGPS